MEERRETKTPWHLWVVGGLLLIWQGLATFDYVATVARFEPWLSQFPDEALAYFFNAPLWMYVIWGVGSIGGLIGVIFLLMRDRKAVPVFLAALIASAVSIFYSFANPPPGDVGGGPGFMIAVLAIAIAIFSYFVWLQKRGVLR